MHNDVRDFWKSINQTKDYSDAEYERIGKQAIASKRLNQAIANGTIQKGTSCVTCDCEDDNLVAHHWKGYDYPFSVWWVCRSCNYYLPHNGISVKDARKLIIDKKFKRPMHFMNYVNKQIEPCSICDVPDKVANMNIVNNYPYEDMLFLCEHCYSAMM